jgi:hypothetical protein
MLCTVDHLPCTKEIDQAAGQEHLHMSLSHPVLRDISFARTLIQDLDLIGMLNRLADIR